MADARGPLSSAIVAVTDAVPADPMAKLGSYGHVLHAHSWNIFRYIGDDLHLFGILVLFLTLAKNRSCTGISRSTQILYFAVFICRYLDLLDHVQKTYLVFFKVTYVVSSFLVLLIFAKLVATYERQKDTCSLVVIFLPCMTAASVVAKDHSAIEVLWSFSMFLEGFAMVPQYIFCYRDQTSNDRGVLVYVLSLGGYRVFYAANWIYKKVHVPNYSDIQSWIGGSIEILLFCDYLLSRFTNYSVLRALVLSVDEKINEIKEQVEMKVRGGSSRAAEVQQSDGQNELRQRRKPEEAPESLEV